MAAVGRLGLQSDMNKHGAVFLADTFLFIKNSGKHGWEWNASTD